MYAKMHGLNTSRFESALAVYITSSDGKSEAQNWRTTARSALPDRSRCISTWRSMTRSVFGVPEGDNKLLRALSLLWALGIMRVGSFGCPA